MRPFQRFRDDRFALTTLQNPNIEVRTYAELVQAAEQERQNQPAPAQLDSTIPATQEQPAPVVPCASDSIPAARFQETVASTAPDPLPPAPSRNVPAHLDSANPDAGNPDPRIEAVKKLAASLGIPVIVETSTLPAVEADPASQHTPKPRRKHRSKSRRKSRGTGNPACAPLTTSTETEVLEQEDFSGLTDLERHSRKCSICNHPDLQSIDEAFLHWRSPKTIMHCFGILSETTIYRHAHAFNFFARRIRNLQSALGNVIEDIDHRDFTGSETLDAVRVLAHINEDGRWIHPTTKSEFIYSAQRLPAGQPALPASRQTDPILIASAPLLENDVNH
jgi:hypothetical protein